VWYSQEENGEDRVSDVVKTGNIDVGYIQRLYLVLVR